MEFFEFCEIYRVAQKTSRTLRTITERRLHGEKFPFADLETSMHCYLLQNFSEVINGATECRLMKWDELEIKIM